MAYKVTMLSLRSNLPMIEDAIVSSEGVQELLDKFFDADAIDVDQFIRRVDTDGKCSKTGSIASSYPYKIKAATFRSREQ